MMSIAEVISMAMAKLLVVILKVRGPYGRTYNYAVGSRVKKIDVEEQAQLFFWVKSSYIDIVGVSMLKGGRHVGKDDGPHVDEVDGHVLKLE